MTFSRLVLGGAVAVVVVVGCAGAPAPSPTSTPLATSTAGASPIVEATTPIATERPTPTPVLETACPTSTPLTVTQFQDADPECQHGTLVIEGWLDSPPGMGFEGPIVEPVWLYYPPDLRMSTLWSDVPIEPDHACSQTNPSCGWFFVHIAPGSGVELVAPPRWVVVTGHIYDPAAATCHYVLASDDPGGFIVKDSDAVAQCMSNFVVDSIEDAPPT